jgi:hypothetical protein
MGIDIYLRWKGITEEEKELQYTGFSIAHGHVGYLRAAYWNREGCQIFYELFPEAYKSEEATPYDFAANQEKMENLLSISQLDFTWKKSMRDFWKLGLSKKNPCIIFSG